MEDQPNRYLQDALIIVVMMVAVYAIFTEGSLLPLLKRVASAVLSFDGNAGVQ